MTSSPSIKDLLALCKLKVVSLILLTAVVGMLLAVPYVPNLLLVVVASVGISLSAMSAAVFNHIIDEDLIKAKITSERLTNSLSKFPENAIYLIDPIGNFMLYYKPQGINIKFVLKDLKRLLKYSRIG